MLETDVAIIGAGPAGIATALQLKRHAIDSVIFEKDKVGGLLKNAHRIENYPGFPQGISGFHLVELLEEHLKVYDINLQFNEVENLEFETREKRFYIYCKGSIWTARLVVVASGTKPCQLDMERNLPAHLRRRILYEVFPLLEEKGKEILIIGAGDAAFDYALSLSPKNSISIVNHGDFIKALPLLKKRVEQDPGIQYFDLSDVKGITAGKDKRLSVSLMLRGKPKILEIDYLLCAIGRVPQKDYYSSDLVFQAENLQKKGLLFEIGDLVKGRYRQAAIATGHGIQVAMTINHDHFDKGNLEKNID